VFTSLWLTACGGGGDSALPAVETPASVSTGLGPGSSGPSAGTGASGAASTALYQVNTSTAGRQTRPDIAQLADGSHVIAWLSTPAYISDPGVEVAPQIEGVCWRRFTAAWAPSGDEVCIPVAGLARDTQVAAVAGGFVVAWTTHADWISSQEYSGGGVWFQRYTAAGSAAGAVQQANAPVGASFGFDLAPLADGGFVLAWEQDADGGSLDPAIMARRYSASGEATTEPQQVHGEAGREMSAVTATALAGGGWLIAWTAYDRQVPEGGTQRLHRRRFNADGTPAGAESLVSTESAAWQRVSGLPDGGYVVAWQAGPILMQRFTADGSAIGAPLEIDPPSQQPQGTCGGRGVPTVSCPPTQRLYDVQTLDDGSFVIAYANVHNTVTTSPDSPPSPGSTFAGHLRRYAADGGLLGIADLDINSDTEVALGASAGGVLAAWEVLTAPATDSEVLARRMETSQLGQR
jgi:hypothetical protein